LDIHPDLSRERLRIVEFLFSPNPAVELEVHFLSPEISGKSQKVSLDFAGLTIKGWAISEIDSCGKPLTICQNGLAGVHPVGWKAFIFRFEVCSGKA
jgi:hypothetical protein